MHGEPWWKHAVIYQIYPRSFQDSNQDGVGDLNGIASRLDYLSWLGIDAIWLSPIYPSPMVDFGYDVADYQGVDPLFGTLEDFDRLVALGARKGIRVILDFVPNHTSDQHPWFVESRSSRNHARRDWYIWRDGKPDGTPPNNWLSEFGGSMWEYDRATEQYYLHSFFKEQPDLNWRNPEVVKAMYDAMRFWLDREVAGFRVDVIDLLLKDAQFRDDPPNPDYGDEDLDWPWKALIHMYSGSQPEVHDIIRGLRSLANQYSGDRILIGELDYFLDNAQVTTFYGDNDELHLPFNFGLFNLTWDAQTVKRFVVDYDQSTPDGARPVYVLSNHDRSRIASRIGRMQARCAAMMILTLRGVPFIYYGEELGMRDVPVPTDQIHDPWGISAPEFGRDPARTPMCWDASLHSGFTTAEPWLPLSPERDHINVEAQKAASSSSLNLYRRLISLRRTTPALLSGGFEPVDADSDAIFAYIRHAQDGRYLTALNFADGASSIKAEWLAGGHLILSTYLDGAGKLKGDSLELRAHEGCVLKLDV